jgi:hypothetical protein
MFARANQNHDGHDAAQCFLRPVRNARSPRSFQLLAVNVVSALKCVVPSVTVTVPWKLPVEA